uniref:small polypeptide DEVIL 13 n=1 Tax=Erigeron canadensis TaxID=72917 RepID=UPI001CB96970|nr:small polypeptide DEVIL 13 [Erigeron canadensis]
MDKKWKLSKEDPCNHSSKSSSLFSRSVSQKNSSSTKSPLLRSFSTKSSSLFSRSSSQKNKSHQHHPCDLSRSSSQKCANFTRKCGSLAKEQKARFYIVKRCVTMLVCWKKHGDS